MSIQIGKIKKINWRKQIKLPKKSIIIFSIFLVIFLVSFYFLAIFFRSKVRHSYFVSANEIEIPISYLSLEGEALSEQYKSYKAYSSTFKSLDKRIYVLDKYFKSRNSPLYGHAKDFVDACNRYNAPVDCIITTAIARHETDLCNYANSAQYFNCMGWGGGGEYRSRFSSFKEHINIATDVLVNQYGHSYMDDPRLMETVFCGQQDECIGWGERIIFFMREIDNFSDNLGVGRLTDLRSDGVRF